MSKALGVALRIAIKSKPNRLGDIEITHVSILEDLWHDYLYFKKQAKNSSTFLQKRYLRAALLVLISYLEGVTNRWFYNLLIEQGKSPEEASTDIRRASIDRKCELLTKQALAKGSLITELAISKIKNLRNELVHLKVGKDLELFIGLSLTALEDAEGKIVDWLNTVSEILGEERHPDTKKLGKKLARISSVAEEEYSGDDVE